MILAQAIENEDLNKIKIILENNPEFIKYLLEHGADINSEETDDYDFVLSHLPSTPLEYALTTIYTNPTENNILAMVQTLVIGIIMVILQ